MSRFTFETTLEGFINVGEPSGKFNNCTFSFRIPPNLLEPIETDRHEALEWAKTKLANPKRCEVALPKWDEDGLVKYSYAGPESRNPVPIFVDAEGTVLSPEIRASIRKGTKARVIVNQVGYPFGQKVGTKFHVLGVQILELNSGAVTDSGELSEAEVIALFQKSAGFTQSAPAPRAVEQEPLGEATAYDF
jgi:hypothetical protein